MILKLFGITILSLAFITGCGEETSDKDIEADDTSNVLSCESTNDAIKGVDNIEIEFEDDKIVGSEMTFESETSFEQSYADSVCTSYEMIDGLTCVGTVKDGIMKYEITTKDETSTTEILSIRESVDASTYDEIKDGLEGKNYTCK